MQEKSQLESFTGNSRFAFYYNDERSPIHLDLSIDKIEIQWESNISILMKDLHIVDLKRINLDSIELNFQEDPILNIQTIAGSIQENKKQKFDCKNQNKLHFFQDIKHSRYELIFSLGIIKTNPLLILQNIRYFKSLSNDLNALKDRLKVAKPKLQELETNF